jgi:hypothetical protein
MYYTSMQNPNANQAAVDSSAKSYTNVNEAFNDIATYLTDGYIWHKRMANMIRKAGIRGVARWHDCEACGDAKELECLEKILGDRFGFYTVAVLMPESVTANFTDLKTHFAAWVQREQRLIDALNYAINEMRDTDACLYDKLFCMFHEVQDEVIKVKLVERRLEFAGWNAHDVGICSMIIHKYFEKDYKQGEDINFNLG